MVEDLFERLNSQSLKFSELDNKTDKEIFNLLENILEYDKSYGKLNSSNVYTLLLIAHWDDALDYWSIYIYEKEDSYIILWSDSQKLSKELKSFKVKKDEFKETLQKFLQYSKHIQ